MKNGRPERAVPVQASLSRMTFVHSLTVVHDSIFAVMADKHDNQGWAAGVSPRQTRQAKTHAHRENCVICVCSPSNVTNTAVVRILRSHHTDGA